MIVEARALILRRNWAPVLACAVLFVVGVLVAREAKPQALQGPLGLFAAWIYAAWRVRVRIAAEACAASDLRDTLLALAEAHDDESTERALACLRR